MTVSQLLKNSYSRLQTEDAADICDILICYVLSTERNRLFLMRNRVISPEEEIKFNDCLQRAIEGEPVQYITGIAPFGRLLFNVNKNVLIPRFDTEILFEEAVCFVNKTKKNNDYKVLDLCTGSGCIGISISYETKSFVVMSDISEEALEIALLNSRRILPDNQYEIISGNLFDGLRGPSEAENTRFNLIVSNPPYIPSAVVEKLDINVRDYEPRLALDGGKDGLDIYRRIIKEAPCFLVKGGCLMLEMGIGESGEIEKMMISEGFSDIKIVKDYGGTDRVISGILY